MDWVGCPECCPGLGGRCGSHLVYVVAQALGILTRKSPSLDVRFIYHVRWQDKAGFFHRDLGDGHAEVTIANRAYRVRIADLRPG
jgi:hypothetical protein